MYKRLFSINILLVFGILSSQPMAAQQPDISDETLQKAEDIIADVKKKEDMKGVSYALVQGEETILKGGMGMASEKRNLPATPETNYYLGSITKLFTLTAIMQLVEKGEVELDDPLNKHITDFSIKSRYDRKNITIRNVLTHHSGLPSDYLKGCISPEPMTKDALVDSLQNEYQAHPSEIKMSYSNIGYTLLGKLIEEVTDQPYKEYMAEQVLDPLGMTNSYHSRTHPRVKPTVSSGFDANGEKKPYPMREVPAGGLYTNAKDMTHFIKMILGEGELDGEQFLRSSTVEKMLTEQNDDIPLDYDFKTGLTWRLAGQPRRPMIQAVPIAWHSGGTVLFSSMLMLLPEQELGVIIHQNTANNGSSTRQLANKVLRLILKESYGIAPKEPPRPEPVNNTADEDLAEMPGTYSSLWGYVRLKQKRNHLRAEVLGRKFKLKPFEDGKYGLRFLLLGFIPIKISLLDGLYFEYREEYGQKLLVLHQAGKTYFFAKKFEPGKPGNHWQQRLGDYENANLGNDHQIIYNPRLRKDENVLYLSFEPKLYDENITMNMPLEPISKNEAVIIGYGRWQGETIRFREQKDTTYLRYSGLQLKKEE